MLYNIIMTVLKAKSTGSVKAAQTAAVAA